jgi:DNA-binding Xre family transcriptional regulator
MDSKTTWNVGSNIKKIRRERRLGQFELAQRLGWTGQNANTASAVMRVGHLERGAHGEQHFNLLRVLCQMCKDPDQMLAEFLATRTVHESQQRYVVGKGSFELLADLCNALECKASEIMEGWNVQH